MKSPFLYLFLHDFYIFSNSSFEHFHISTAVMIHSSREIMKFY